MHVTKACKPPAIGGKVLKTAAQPHIRVNTRSHTAAGEEMSRDEENGTSTRARTQARVTATAPNPAEPTRPPEQQTPPHPAVERKRVARATATHTQYYVSVTASAKGAQRPGAGASPAHT